MNRATLTAACLVAATLVASTAILSVAGPLSPPAGPVAPSHKTLAQVEPRTPISALPLVIASPGSYYLTGDLSVASGVAIEVQVAGVSIDLNGFSIRNSGAATHGVSSNQSRVRISNGGFHGFGQFGIRALGSDVHVSDVRVTVAAPGAVGINASGARAFVRRCSVSRPVGPDPSTEFGIFTQGVGAVIEDCTASGFEFGIYAGRSAVVAGCRASDCGIGIFLTQNTSVSDSTAERNGTGFYLVSNTVARGCVARDNDLGFRVDDGSVVTSCEARLNESGFFAYGSLVQDCVAADNATDGISASDGSVVRRCIVSGSVRGLSLNGSSLADLNACDDNSATGIAAANSDNRIEANTLTDNGNGINTSSSGNLIARNAASGNTTNYSTTVGDTYGPVLSAPGPITSTNFWANFGF